MSKTSIKQFLDSQAGQEMKEFLQSKLDELDSVQSLTVLHNAQDIAVEVKAHKKAVGILKDIFSKIGTFSNEPKGRAEVDKLHDL